MSKNRVSKRFARALSLLIFFCMLLSLGAAHAECAHANTYTDKTFAGYGEDYMPSQHLVVYEERKYCSDCRILLSEDWPEEWISHSVVNGTCACGYRDDVPCGHPVRNDGGSVIEYESISSREHSAIKWIDTVCGICGEVVDVLGEDLGTESHSFSNNVCTKCFYEKPLATKFCSRCNEMRTWSDVPNYTLYSQLVNGQHSKWHGTVEKCNHCGYTVEKKMDNQVFENHTFVDGKCVCGAKEASASPTSKPTQAPCNHSGTTLYDRVDVFTDTYSMHNSSQHIKHTRDQVFCPCGAMLYENNWDSYEAHVIRGEKCIHCGYRKSSGNQTPPSAPAAPQTPSAPQSPASTDAPSFPGVLSKESASNTRAKVKEIQNLLLKNGYTLPQYGADGDFGAETEAAVKKFQQDHALPVTGVIDEITWNKLVNPNEEEEKLESEVCEHLYSTPHRKNGASKYYRCVLCNHELLVVSDEPDSFEESLEKYAQDAVKDGSEINKVYDKLLDASNKTAFNQLFSEIMDKYHKKGVFQTSTENLYNFISDIPGSIGSLFTDQDDFDAKFNAKLENNIKRALIQANQNELFNLTDIKKKHTVVDTASSAVNEFVKIALEGKNPKVLEKVDLAGNWSGYGLSAMGFAVETVDIINCTYGEITMLGSLVASYDYNMTMLDAMIEQNGADSAISQACQRIKDDMTNEFKANARSIGEAKKDITGKAFGSVLGLGVDSLLGNLATDETIDLMYAKVTDKKIKIFSKTINNPNFLKVASGVASGILLGSDIGTLIANDTGVMLEAKEEILINATMESMIRNSVEDAYDDRSDALQPLTQLWIVTQMDGLNATEKYIMAYEHESEKHLHKEETGTVKKLSLGEFVFSLLWKDIKKEIGISPANRAGKYFIENVAQGAEMFSDASLELIFGDLFQRSADIDNQKTSIQEDRAALKELSAALGFSTGVSFPPHMLLTQSATPPTGDSLEEPFYYEYLPYTLHVYNQPSADSEPIARFEVTENGLWLPYDKVRTFTQDGRTWTEAKNGESVIYFTTDEPTLEDALKLWDIDLK